MPPEFEDHGVAMSDRSAMTDLQLRAYGYMAEAMALFLLEKHTGPFDGHPDDEPVFYHYSQGAFERASFVLEQLGILAPFGDTEDERSAVLFTFKCNADEFRNIARSNWEAGPSFHEMLWQFCDLIGYDAFNFELEKIFTVSNRYRLVMECLVGLGYAKSTSEGFVWTLKFLPYATTHQNWVSGEKANAAIAKLPVDARERLFELMKQGHGINAVGLFRHITGTSTEVASFAIELMYSELPAD